LLFFFLALLRVVAGDDDGVVSAALLLLPLLLLLLPLPRFLPSLVKFFSLLHGVRPAASPARTAGDGGAMKRKRSGRSVASSHKQSMVDGDENGMDVGGGVL
jgi:hypothetical protein